MNRRVVLNNKDQKLIYDALVCYELYLQNAQAQEAMKGMCQSANLTLLQDQEHWVSDTIENIDHLLERFTRDNT